MALSPQVSARLLALSVIVASFALGWRHSNTVHLVVLGQPSTAGKPQRDLEAPFFQQLASRAQVPLIVDYQTADTYGLKDSHQLKALRDGRLDIVSLRFMHNIENEQVLLGIDLPGMNPDFQTARTMAHAYSPILDKYLQKTYNAKLLGIWVFGPQVMFCKDAIANLSEVRGRKVRVATPTLAQVIEGLGGTAVTLPFNEAKQALNLDLVDCAVTSAASADFDDWGAYTKYYFPLVFQFGFNGYVISKKKWNALSPDQQHRLSQAFSLYINNLWENSKKLQREAEACLTQGPCLSHPPKQLQSMPVSSQDMHLLKQISKQTSLPRWLEICEQKHHGCRQDWNQTVAPLTGLSSQAVRP